jgi:hypothetical protein
LTNAGRIYLDMGHLAYASPECQSLTDRGPSTISDWVIRCR